MQLANNWPDGSKEKVRDKSPLIDLDTQKQLGDRAEGGSHRERLSEETVSIIVRNRCDSPNPDKIQEVIELWKQGLVWKEIAKISQVPERTARRYLAKLGYKRDYVFVAEKMKDYARNRRPKEVYEKISITRILKGVAKGEKNPNWQGGIQDRFNQVYRSPEYQIWRKGVFERDNYTCRGCEAKRNLRAHHILPRRDFIHLIFELSNGITLCKKCHDKTINKEYLSVNIWKQRV